MKQEAGYETVNGFVHVPLSDFKAMQERLEELEDGLALEEALSRPQEFVSGEAARRIVRGENPVRVFREEKGMTQKLLADETGVTQATISEIETGRKTGSVEVLKAIADALGVSLDDLV
jgi:DNA-binding XRE family transcriptional regulator